MPINPVSGKIQSQGINDNLSYLDSIKRDKTVEIEMNELSQEIKEGMTGGAVPVVGVDAVDTENIKDNATITSKRTVLGEWVGYINNYGYKPNFNIENETLTFPIGGQLISRDKVYTLDEKIIDYSLVNSDWVRIFFNVVTEIFQSITLTEIPSDSENCLLVGTGAKGRKNWNTLFDYGIEGIIPVTSQNLESQTYSIQVNKNTMLEIMPHRAIDEWSFQESLSDSIFLYTTYIAFRNYTYSVSETYHWGDVQTQINDATRFVTPPNPVRDDFLEIKHAEMLCLNNETNGLEIVSSVVVEYPKYTTLAFCWNGKLVNGAITNNIVAKNSRDIKEINNIIGNQVGTGLPSYATSELTDTSNKINLQTSVDKLTFGFITDTHGWDEHIDTLAELSKIVNLDFVVHGGDHTEGDTIDAETVRGSFERTSRALNKIDCPTFTIKGNHDGDPNGLVTYAEWANRFSRKSFINRTVVYDDNAPDDGYYYIDDEEKKIRSVFMNSSWVSRYGFHIPQLEWFATTALDFTGKMDWQLLVFGHHNIRTEYSSIGGSCANADIMTGLLKSFYDGSTYSDGGSGISVDFTTQGSRLIIAYVFGHLHADIMDTPIDLGFPMICTVCSLPQKATPVATSTVYDRTIGTLSEDAWDVFMIDTQARTIDVIRYGVGNDRSTTY